MERHCNGGNGRLHKWCGKPATVVVSCVMDDYALQWYACDDPEHHKYEEYLARTPYPTTTEPLGAWLARNGRE